MTTLPIGDIIRDSFKLAWKHKYLWLFGLFAAGGGSVNFPGGGDDLNFERLEAAKEWLLAALAMIVLIVVMIGLIVLIINVISKTALIYNVYQVETNGAHGIGIGWDFGLKRFWPMLGITLLQFVVMFSFVVVVAGIEVLVFIASVPLGFFSLLFALPVMLLSIAVLKLVWGYAERFAILETRGVIESIGEGWSLLREQWKPSATMLLVKIGISIAVAIGVMGVGAALFLPAVALWLIAKPLAVIYGLLLFLPYAVLTGAYFGTFDSAVWTKVFLHLRAPAYAASSTAPPPSSEPPPPASPPVFE